MKVYGAAVKSNRECQATIPMSQVAQNTSELLQEPLKVGVLSLDMPQWACPEIRLLGPFRHLVGDIEPLWVFRRESRDKWIIDRDRLDMASAIVVQRYFPNKDTIKLLEILKLIGKPIIYETDDLLTGLPKSNPHYEDTLASLPYIEMAICMADFVVVSTQQLKSAYAKYNKNIRVIQNYLDDSIWLKQLPVCKEINDSVRILFSGTVTHLEDLLLILPALEKIKKIHDKFVQFVFMGMRPPIEANLGNIEFIEFNDNYQAYATKLRGLSVDLAVVPLSENSFNRAKSPIKWLEYSVNGIPGVYSDLSPYSFVDQGRTGLRVSNDADAWFDAIDTLVRSEGLRKKIAVSAKEEVEKNWMLSSHLREYKELYKDVSIYLHNIGLINKVETKENNEIMGSLWASGDFEKKYPKIDILIRGNCGDEEALLGTENALVEQWVRPNSVLRVAGATLPKINEIIGSCLGDWILLLRVGDKCSPGLLAALMRYIEEHPHVALIYFDEAQIDHDGVHVNAHYKPDFNLEYLRSIPYVGGSIAVRRCQFEASGGFYPEYEGVEEYEFVFRIYEKHGALGVGHVSGELIGHKVGVNLTEKPMGAVLEAGRQAVLNHLLRLGVGGVVDSGPLPATLRVRYQHDVQPLVSIIIPTRNEQALLDRCIQSLFANTSWQNFELIIIDNNSDDEIAVKYLAGLGDLGLELHGRIRVLAYQKSFNYSEMNNLAALEARGEYLLLLNNDTAALHPDWLSEMMSYAQQEDVGVVGAKLLYPDGKVQHAGVVLGMKGPAEHPFVGFDASAPGYYGRLQLAQEYSAVTGACLLVRKSLFEEVGGLDADKLAVSYSDIDLCLKIGELGKRVIWTPYAVLMHEGSKSQNNNVEGVQDKVKVDRFNSERSVMYHRWLSRMPLDPAYNRNLSLASTAFEFEQDEALRWDPSWRPAPRVIAQPADRMGCGEYRIIAPTRALINSGRIQGLESERIYSPPELARIRPDALVLQRQLEPHQIQAIESHKRFNDVFCVFEIDDLITNVPVKNAHKKHLPKDVFKRLRKAIGLCDRLVVATEPLAEAYNGLCEDIRVVPNFIENARWGGFTPSRGLGVKPRVGWAGGISHTGDLELIYGVVEALKDEVEWVFFGMCPPGLAPFVHEYHEPVSIDAYPAKLASLNLDLAIAPLEDVPFNHAKSHLRLLEYGMLGYPVVCTDFVPYQGGFPVTLVRNRYKDWIDAIRTHTDDLDATARMGDLLRNHICEHWLLENNLDHWLTAWLP